MKELPINHVIRHKKLITQKRKIDGKKGLSKGINSTGKGCLSFIYRMYYKFSYKIKNKKHKTLPTFQKVNF